jgi:hypothetical protein
MKSLFKSLFGKKQADMATVQNTEAAQPAPQTPSHLKLEPNPALKTATAPATAAPRIATSAPSTAPVQRAAPGFAPKMTTPAPHPKPAMRQAPLPHAPPPAASRDIATEIYGSGPEMKITTKGSNNVYGHCPSCEATFSLRERLKVYRLSLTTEPKALTCPSCSAPISVPRSFDLRKLA